MDYVKRYEAMYGPGTASAFGWMLAYYKIPHASVRKRIFELTKSLAKSSLTDED